MITNDKDFGEKVYREHHPHKGIVLIRLDNERSTNKIEILRKLLLNHSSVLPNRFVVVTETGVRFAVHK